MKRILIPVDFSEDSVFALRVGMRLANQFEARLRMIHVKTGHRYAPEFSGDNPQMRLLGQVGEWLEHLQTKYSSDYCVPNGQFDYKIREGNVMREIANQALYDDTSLIVVGTHGISGVEDRWVGSDAFRLVSNAPCPVLTVHKEMEWKGPHRVLVPMDDSRFMRMIVPTVAGFSSLIKASVALVALQKKSVWILPEKSKLYTRQAERYFKRNYSMDVASYSFDWKDDAQQILEFSHEQKATVIAIPLHKNLNPFGSLFRPFANELLNLSDIPVLVIPVKA